MPRIALLLMLGFGIAAGAWAQSAPGTATSAPAVANPYSATVPVAGTSDADRSQAIAAALKIVLQQVSPGFTPGDTVLSSASDYVRDFHYQRGAAGSGLDLKVDFDPGAVTRILKEGGAASGVAGTGATSANPANPGVASSSAPGVPTSGTATLWIGGIDSSHAFASALAMLRGDSRLSHVVPVAAEHDGVLLQVDYSAPLATVLATLETPDGHLTQDASAHPGADASLEWNP